MSPTVTSSFGFAASAAAATISSPLQHQQQQQHLAYNPATSFASLASSPSAGSEDRERDLFISGGVIAVLVLGSLCLVLGIIYGYIYFTRINPRSNRIRKYIEQSTQMDDGAQTTSTHLFLFKKS